MIIYMLGRIALVEAVLLVLPLTCAIIYSESTIISFLLTIGIALAFGGICSVLKPKNKTIYAKVFNGGIMANKVFFTFFITYVYYAPAKNGRTHIGLLKTAVAVIIRFKGTWRF